MQQNMQLFPDQLASDTEWQRRPSPDQSIVVVAVN